MPVITNVHKKDVIFIILCRNLKLTTSSAVPFLSYQLDTKYVSYFGKIHKEIGT